MKRHSASLEALLAAALVACSQYGCSPSPDAASPDAASPDAASPDGRLPDGGLPDGGSPDAGSPDGGSPDGGSPASGPLAALWAGRLRLVVDPAFAPPTELGGHVETATVAHGGQYLMLYRTFVDQPAGQPAIALATSTDGDTWTAHNGGRPVLARGGAPGGIDDGYLIAPAVVSDGTTLTAVYEAWAGSGKQVVAAAQSSDGITWSKLGTVVPASSSGWESGNTGTPSMLREGGVTSVFYHGFRGSDGTGALARGFASGSSVTALVKHGPPVLTGLAGTWTDVGIGRGDVLREGAFYYMVFEGTDGSAMCTASAKYGWGLARSADLVTWEVWPHNPVLTDTDGSCGNDMPSWQTIGNRIMVVTTRSDTNGVRRFKLEPAAAAGTALATYQAETQLSHLVGHVDGTDWVATAPGESAGALAYGPYVTTLPSGVAEARFRLAGSGVPGGTVVATLEVNDSTANTVRATVDATGSQLPASGYVEIAVPFLVPPDPHALEFRVWWKGLGTLRLDRVTVTAR